MKHHLLMVSLLILGLCVFGASAAAQPPVPISQDFFKVNYFANNGVSGAPDATVRINNPGSPAVTTGLTPGVTPLTVPEAINLCAMIYVFDNDQQLTECCGCEITPDGLRTLSVSKDLTSNPLTGIVSNSGVIQIISTPINDEPCDPTGSTGPVAPVAAFRAWATHIENKVGSSYPITETEFSNATLSGEEFGTDLLGQCFFAQRLGSGHGVCSCGTGD